MAKDCKLHTWLKARPFLRNVRTNERGNIVKRFGTSDGYDRYLFDIELCRYNHGWKQYDTDQDAWYFGVWVHPVTRRIVTYAEGDISDVRCVSPESYHAELASMAEFYGEAPPAAISISRDGTVTRFYDERPA